MLVNGQWVENWQPVQAIDQEGGFVRQISSFRNWVTPDGQAGPTGEGGFQAEKGRYHLYVALICPWASRTLIARELKGLTEIVSVSVVEPQLSDFGWRFGHAFSADTDSLNHKQYMHEIYTLADPNFTGRATVPVLWDKKRKTIVNNESSDIVRMFNSGFSDLAQSDYELYPEKLQPEIDALNEQIYQKLNNGVYRAGFATTQIAYEHAVADVFDMLEQLEERLSQRRYVFGNELTETDIRLFVTLIRFDVAYHGLFKCNLKQLRHYPHLTRYVQDILMISGIAQTVNFEHIKQGYYSIKSLNPLGIVPVGPEINFQLPI
ncbi:glutathione S-transferase family protein [Acinetobacter brisouii]